MWKWKLSKFIHGLFIPWRFDLSSTNIGLVFSGEISKVSLDCVLGYCDTIALKTPKSREKNEGRRYFDYCGITTTEYKWTTPRLLFD